MLFRVYGALPVVGLNFTPSVSWSLISLFPYAAAFKSQNSSPVKYGLAEAFYLNSVQKEWGPAAVLVIVSFSIYRAFQINSTKKNFESEVLDSWKNAIENTV
jgi:hypothetical protein